MENDYQENLEERLERDKEEQKKIKKNKTISKKITDNAVDKSLLRFAPKSVKGVAKDVGQTILTGKLLKGKSSWKKFLIVTAVIIASFFGGLEFLIKCFGEEPMFTSMVIVFWSMIIILLIAFLLMMAVAASCQIIGPILAYILESVLGFNLCP